MKLINYTLDKVQITCPNCKYEFPYNKRALENRIKAVGQTIFEKRNELAKISKIPKEKLNKEEVKRRKKEIEYFESHLMDLKMKRDTLKDQEDDLVLKNLKYLIKEQYGEEVYARILDEALRRSTAYDTEDMMSIGYYSRAGGKKISKIG